MWGAVPSQVAAVAGSQPAVAVHPDGILVVLEHLCYHTCVVPFAWVVAVLVLDMDPVPTPEW